MTPMIVEHPLLQHKLSILRNKQTGTKEFRDLVGEIATLLCYEATRDLPMEEVEIETPITMAKTKVLAGRKLALVPILRAGMGMLDGMLTLLPAAKVGFIGLYRNEETLQPVEYFCKLPQDIAERDVLVLDPMLATGGSAIDAITQIKKHGAKRIKFIGLIAAPEGIEALHKAHPDVDIYLGAKDDHLNENGYIVPGLGDAGDRIYGTKKMDVVTGEMASPLIRQMMAELHRQYPMVEVTVHTIKNKFFGGNVGVAGLVTATDIIAQCEGKLTSGTLGVPAVMLREEKDTFLDDITTDQLAQRLGVKVEVLPTSGGDEARALLRSGLHIARRRRA